MSYRRLKQGDVKRVFINGDHYQLGLRYGRTLAQIMKWCGIENYDMDTDAGRYQRHVACTIVNQARVSLLKEEPPRFLDSIKLHKKPTVYFLVNPGTEEMARYFEKYYTRLKTLKHNVKNLQVYIQQSLPQIKDEKVKRLLTDAYSKKI